MRTLLAERQARRARDDFARQLIAAQEKERRRSAGELHDGRGQDLLVIANQAQFGLAKTEDLRGTAARLKEIAETARHAVQQVRRMAYDLRPGLLDIR
jgi:signal transduction histidine kinase